MKKPKTNPLGFRIDADLKEALTRAAVDDQRSVSAMTQIILRQWLTERGYVQPKPRAPRKRPAQRIAVQHDARIQMRGP